MKTIITSTRIPADQANGSYNILLPGSFGQPKGFLVYAMPYSVQPNNFDSTTTFPCISVGFGGSNTAGTGLTNACAWVSNEDGASTTNTRASFGNTVSAFSRNINNTVWRQWQMTGFGPNIIFGQYSSSGTQAEPMDLVFTVFGGDDFFCAVGQTAIVAAINTRTDVATPFQPDAILYSHIRPAQTTDGQMTFGAARRSVFSSAGNTVADSLQVSGNWRNENGQNTSIVSNRYSTTGSFNIATNAVVKFAFMYDSGFAVTQSTANSGNSIIFLAMKAGISNATQYRFDYLTTNSASTGSTQKSFNNTYGFIHALGWFSNTSNPNATATTSATGADMFSFFTANGDTKSNTVGIGTFTSSTSSTTITGVGTSFLGQLGAIDNIYNENYQLVGIVSSITSNTSLLLQSNAAITATGSSFIFEKPKQFSMSYGLQDADPNGNANMRGYFADDALIAFTAATPTLVSRGHIRNFNGNNSPSVYTGGIDANFIIGPGVGFCGWMFVIRGEELFNGKSRIF